MTGFNKPQGSRGKRQLREPRDIPKVIPGMFSIKTNKKEAASWLTQITCTLKLHFNLVHFIQFSQYHSILPFVK